MFEIIQAPQRKAPHSILYNSRKLSLFFSLKDKTDEQHKHNLVYAFQCGECNRNYTGETGMRIGKRIDEHLTTDKNCMSISMWHKRDTQSTRRVSPSLAVAMGTTKSGKLQRLHQKKLNLNKQKGSVALQLYKWFHDMLYSYLTYMRHHLSFLLLSLYLYIPFAFHTLAFYAIIEVLAIFCKSILSM